MLSDLQVLNTKLPNYSITHRTFSPVLLPTLPSMARLAIIKEWGIIWPAISLIGLTGGFYGIYKGVSVIRQELQVARLKQDWKNSFPR